MTPFSMSHFRITIGISGGDSYKHIKTTSRSRYLDFISARLLLLQLVDPATGVVSFHIYLCSFERKYREKKSASLGDDGVHSSHALKWVLFELYLHSDGV